MKFGAKPILGRGRKTPHVSGAVTFTGIKEIDDKLKAMNSSMQKKPLRKATRAVGKLVLEQMRAEVPENEGFLRSQLKLKAKKRSRKYPETVGITVGFPDDLFMGDTFYAGFLEFGTAQRRTKSGANRGKIPEGRFDFMRPALWSYTERKLAIFRQAIVEWMRQQAAKGK
jgi:HK97 gp10 family phage protein